MTLEQGRYRKYAPYVFTEQGIAADHATKIQSVLDTIEQLIEAFAEETNKRRIGFPLGGQLSAASD